MTFFRGMCTVKKTSRESKSIQNLFKIGIFTFTIQFLPFKKSSLQSIMLILKKREGLFDLAVFI
jgi:hypothetical protein